MLTGGAQRADLSANSADVTTPLRKATLHKPRIVAGLEHELDPAQRAPPHSLEAEQALLGAILINNAAFERVRGRLEPNDFFDPLHRVIFDYCRQFIDEGRKADPITLRPYFENAAPIDGTLSAVAYLAKLLANAVTIDYAGEYAKEIRFCAIRRSLVLQGEDMLAAAYDAPPDFTPCQQVEEHLKRLEAIDAPATRVTPVAVSSFAGLPVPEREWHVKDLIPARNATSLGGDVGK